MRWRSGKIGAKKTKRRGLAVVEFAICAPLILMLVMGTIETANFIHLRQVLSVASYESALRATAIGGTQADATTQGQLVLNAYGITDGTLTFSPQVNETTPVGTPVTVTVTISRSRFANSPMMYFQGPTITAATTMMRL